MSEPSMVTSSFWLWAAQRSFYLTHVRVSTDYALRGPDAALPLREGSPRSRTGHVGTVALSLYSGGSLPPLYNENRV